MRVADSPFENQLYYPDTTFAIHGRAAEGPRIRGENMGILGTYMQGEGSAGKGVMLVCRRLVVVMTGQKR